MQVKSNQIKRRENPVPKLEGRKEGGRMYSLPDLHIISQGPAEASRGGKH